MPFDWDNIDCASPDLENSAQFFSVRHVGHEKDFINEENKLCILKEKENAGTAESHEIIAVNAAKVIVDKKSPSQTQVKTNKPITKKIPLKTRLDVVAAAPKNFCKVGRIHSKNVVKVESKKEAKPVCPIKNVVPVAPKLNEFRAKPAPNFKLLHQKQTIIPKKSTITIPHTPTVLRKSQIQPNPRKRQISKGPPEIKKITDLRKNYGNIARKEPFRPKKEIKTTQVVPFNLQTTRRHEERQRFDDLMRQMRDLKVQKQLQDKKKHEENLRKELRKKTQFRARPNPFK